MVHESRGALGSYAEQLAAHYLQERGYVIVARNYRKPWGELDIIAQRDDILVFVEVKANGQSFPGFEPEIRANRQKQEKIVRTARTYLAQYGFQDRPWQIDVVAVTIDRGAKTARIKHFKNIEI